ncbi:Uncharacterized protein Rs2_46965 [Raphanus sativus]|nr:Uncharacterized protein Rs2_46965 [Raphanus sativus]
MGQLLRVISGQWTKCSDGEWRFHGDPSAVEHYILTKTNDGIHTLISLVREELEIEQETPMVLSYRLPSTMLLPEGSTSAPTNIVDAEDVELMFSVQEWTKEVELCVTYGSAKVAKYQFLCREPFTVELVGEDEFDCTGLAHIFNEKNMVTVYRLSLEIEKARSTFGEINNGNDEVDKISSDDDRQRKNIQNRFEKVNPTVFPEDQEFRTTPQRNHRPTTPNYSYTRNENNEVNQFCESDERDNDVGEDCWNEFINLEFEDSRTESFNKGDNEILITLSNDISGDGHASPINQPPIVHIGESSTDSTPGSLRNLQFPYQNDLNFCNGGGNEQDKLQDVNDEAALERGRMNNMETGEGASEVMGPHHEDPIEVDLTVEEDSFVLRNSNVDVLTNPVVKL